MRAATARRAETRVRGRGAPLPGMTCIFSSSSRPGKHALAKLPAQHMQLSLRAGLTMGFRRYDCCGRVDGDVSASLIRCRVIQLENASPLLCWLPASRGDELQHSGATWDETEGDHGPAPILAADR